MLDIVFLLGLVGAVVGFIVVQANHFKAEGQTVGICVEVKTEVEKDDGSPYNEQLRGMDSRMYRPYIKYTWNGTEYLAKSYAAYSNAKIFPGDRVNIQVSRSDKSVVKIIG